MAQKVQLGGRIVDDSSAPAAWILADSSGNRACIAAWPDGAPRPDYSAAPSEKTHPPRVQLLAAPRRMGSAAEPPCPDTVGRDLPGGKVPAHRSR